MLSLILLLLHTLHSVGVTTELNVHNLLDSQLVESKLFSKERHTPY